MALGGFTFPLILHLALAYPGSRPSSAPGRALIAAYAEALLAAAVLALFRDPYLDPGCLANCNVNAFLIRSLPSVARAAGLAGRWLTAAAAAGLIAICAARLVAGSRPARRRLLPVAVPAIMFAAAVAARAIALQRTTVEDPFNAALFTIFAVASAAIIVLAAGLISGVARSRAERRAIARIAVNLDKAPSPGSLQTALAEALHDPELRIAYRLPGAQRYVDASGRATPEPAATPDRAVTRVIKDGRTIAAISHAGPLPDLTATSGAPSGSAWRTNGCKPNWLPSSESFARPGPASSRPPAPSAAGSNETCTTAPSNTCWPCPTTSGSPGPAPRPTVTPRPR